MSVTNAPAVLIMRASLPLSKPYVAPNNELEALAATTFAEVFNLDKVGIDDEFFELGGDSLFAEVLSLALSQRLGMELQPSLLVEFGSPRQFVSHLESKSAQPALGKKVALLNPEIERRIRAFVSGWKGDRRRPEALISGLNIMGRKRPIFWCFQGAEEFSRLALHLGPERPLYGMRSGYLLMDSTEASCNALAQRYFEEILSLEERGPYLIGGNCRGGGVAVEIAQKLQDSGRHVLLLVLLDVRIWETFRSRLYPGKVAAYTGAYSRFNPYRQFRNPELGWRKLFNQGLKFELLPADHGQYFSDAVLPFFAGKLEAALQWAEGSTTLVSGNGASGGPLPQEAYRAGLHASKKFEFKRAERRTIVVKVKNRSKVNWPAAAESGISLGNHWLTPEGEILIWADGRAALRHSLSAGLSQTLTLEVSAPDKPGDYLLELDLVEEGVAWFKERGSPSAIIPVTVLDRTNRFVWLSKALGRNN